MESQHLRKLGFKATLPRLRILQLLETSRERHMSAEDVYKALLNSGDDVGLATVYRVLTQFESAGLVIRHHFEGTTAVFELADHHHHDHIVCVECGKIEEFVDNVIEERQQAIALEKGLTITNHSHYIYATCQDKKTCKDYQATKAPKKT